MVCVQVQPWAGFLWNLDFIELDPESLDIMIFWNHVQYGKISMFLSVTNTMYENTQNKCKDRLLSHYAQC